MEKRKLLTLIGMGILVGFINGFFGGGGGMLVVPILIYVLKLPVKQAHATTLLIILPMAVASLITYMLRADMDFMNGLYVAVGTSAGGLLGAFLLKKAKSGVVQLLFAAVMVGSGIYMLV